MENEPLVQTNIALEVAPEDPTRHGRFNVKVEPNVITDRDGELISTLPEGVQPEDWVSGLKFVDD